MAIQVESTLALLEILDLGSDQAARRHDVLLEWQAHHPTGQYSTFLSHLGAHLGVYPSTVQLDLKQLVQAARQQVLFHELGEQHWVVLKAGSKGKLWIYRAHRKTPSFRAGFYGVDAVGV